ncbi:MAG TPA: PEP-utilizing enzyme [Anaerolineales bacterium]|nr:PEP-utilizing enzyme [Anaerolineales bacterium]
MFDNSEVLAKFYGDESFPVEWKNEEEKKLLWFFDDNHVPNPISPMYFSLNGWWGPTLDYMYRRFGFPIGAAWNGKRVNGYLYSAISPRDPKEAGLLGPYYGMVMPTYANNFLDWWQTRYLPEVKANFNYLDTFNTEKASLPELMVFLEEAIDIQERHFRLHWILNLAQFQSSITFQTLAGQVIPNVSGALIGRILISLEDKNWDSVNELWKLKEAVKANPELKNIFESKETASAILPALQGSAVGKAFMEQVTAYLKEYGYKPLYTHEYMYKLWVENPAPAIETIKGYLVADYNFPVEFAKIKKDQQSAMDELRASIPAGTPTDKSEALIEAMRLAVKMMPLTPDHHYYFDQGTFARLRLVLVGIGRKMVKLGLLRDAEDIMFLEYEQLRAYTANPKSESNPGGYDGIGVIKAARRAWEDAFKVTPRDWVGTVTHWNMYEEIYHTLWGYPEKFDRARDGKKPIASQVNGLPAAAGVSEGIAHVVKSPEEFDQVRQGEILVCVMTNPAWVIVFSKIKGVITDAGGVLSHTAVVSREFGIPAVVGTSDATRRIKTGDRVRVNGTTGCVDILESAI